MANTRQPGSVPYRWLWVLGVALILIAVLLAVQGAILWAAIAVGFAGAMIVILGFTERDRGGPPI